MGIYRGYDEKKDAGFVQNIAVFRENWATLGGWVFDRTNGSDASVSVSGQSLTFNSGTVAGTAMLTSRARFTLPLALSIIASISQRIANQNIFFELVSVDGNTDLVDGTAIGNLQSGQATGLGRNVAAYLFNGTVNTVASIDTACTGSARNNAATTVTATSAAQVFGLEVSETSTGQYTRAVDSTASRSAATLLRDQFSPDPTQPYAIRIRVQNTAVVTNTVITVGQITCMVRDNVTVDLVAKGSLNPLDSASFIAQGNQASGVVASGNPVQIAANARSTNPAAVADGAVVRPHADVLGRMVVQPGAVIQLQDRNRAVITVATETTLIAAVASVRHVLTDLLIANLNTTNPVQVDIRDSTAGTIRQTFQIPAGQSFEFTSAMGVAQAAVNNNWTVTLTGTAPNVAVSSNSFRVNY